LAWLGSPKIREDLSGFFCFGDRESARIGSDPPPRKNLDFFGEINVLGANGTGLPVRQPSGECHYVD